MRTRTPRSDGGRPADERDSGHGGASAGRAPTNTNSAFERGGSGLHAMRARLAENRVDPFDQLARAERLGDVVVGAHFEADLLVHVATLRGQQNDRDLAGAFLGFEQL